MVGEKMTGNVRVVRSSESKDYRRFTGEQIRGLEDTGLSIGALGVWMYLTTLPEDSEFTLEDLQEASPNDKPEDLARYYQELIDRGYIEE